MLDTSLQTSQVLRWRTDEDNEPPLWEGPDLVAIHEVGGSQIARWPSGRTLDLQEGRYEIIACYDEVLSLAQAQTRLVAEFAPIAGAPCQATGWLAPDGRWFPCSIPLTSAQYLLTLACGAGLQYNLLANGWLVVWASGHVKGSPHIGVATLAQLATLQALSAVGDEGWQCALSRVLTMPHPQGGAP